MLPIIESPKFSLKVPSTGKIVEYRPFLVKEEKILLIAQESSNSRDIVTAMKDVVRACTFNKVDPNDLTSYDLEYIFLKLRTKSVGEITTVKVKCDHCETYNPIEVNLDEVDVVWPPNKPSNMIMLTDSIGVNMRHIRVKDIATITDNKKSSADQMTDTIIASIESIFDANGVYLTDETKKDELIQFVGSLNRSQMSKIEEFISSAPKVEKEVNFECKGCKNQNTIKLQGTQTFFD